MHHRLWKLDAMLHLMQVIHELRRRQEAEVQQLVCEASPEEADTAYERALQASRATSADSENEVKAYGMEAMSTTTARRRVSATANMVPARCIWGHPAGRPVVCGDVAFCGDIG